MNLIKTALEAMYLEWANDFLTIERYAEYHEIDKELAKRIIRAGRNINRIKYT